MKVGDIVELRDASYSMALVEGVLKRVWGIFHHHCHYRVLALEGAYPTDNPFDHGASNDIMLVDVNDPNFVLFTQERFCRALAPECATGPATIVKIPVPRGTKEVRLIL